MSDFFRTHIDIVRNRIYDRPMRDGIFRSAPVPKSWRKFGGCASREADHGPRLIEAGEEALRKDAQHLKKKIQQFMLIKNNLSLLSNQQQVKYLAENLDITSQFESDFRDSALSRCSKGAFQGIERVIHESAVYALKRHFLAMMSEFKGHASRKYPTDIDSLTKGFKALDASAAGIDFIGIAKSFTNPVEGRTRRQSNQPFNYDENLLR